MAKVLSASREVRVVGLGVTVTGGATTMGPEPESSLAGPKCLRLLLSSPLAFDFVTRPSTAMSPASESALMPNSALRLSPNSVTTAVVTNNIAETASAAVRSVARRPGFFVFIVMA